MIGKRGLPRLHCCARGWSGSSRALGASTRSGGPRAYTPRAAGTEALRRCSAPRLGATREPPRRAPRPTASHAAARRSSPSTDPRAPRQRAAVRVTSLRARTAALGARTCWMLLAAVRIPWRRRGRRDAGGVARSPETAGPSHVRPPEPGPAGSRRVSATPPKSRRPRRQDGCRPNQQPAAAASSLTRRSGAADDAGPTRASSRVAKLSDHARQPVAAAYSASSSRPRAAAPDGQSPDAMAPRPISFVPPSPTSAALSTSALM
jgi:hypothetical protein